MAEISLRKINKIYDGRVHAVHDLSLEIADGDFVVLVGPSGCGKSTVLRMIAGLEEISFGELLIDGDLVNELPPKERKIAMVFQNYALFPHMTVYENIAFGLKLAKTDREEVKARVEEAADILGIKNLLSRKPAQLSGGQKQRVALGRAIVCKPRIFLLDEPLSNLDAKLRASMRSELVKLHNKLGTTFIYVTHDQTEALTMGTKIAVLKDGYLQQFDSPTQIYEYPANNFVASFMGSPQINLFSVTLERRKKGLGICFANGDFLVFQQETAQRLVNEKYVGKKVVLGIRPENLSIAKRKTEAQFFGATDLSETLGSSVILHLNVEGALNPTTSLLNGRDSVAAGQTVGLKTDARYIQLFDEEEGISLFDVPACNLINAKLQIEGETLRLTVGKIHFTLNKYDYLLSERTEEGGNVVLGLPVTQPAVHDCAQVALRAKVDFIYSQHSRTLVYTTVEGTEERFLFVCNENADYEVGKSYMFPIDAEEVQLFDGDGNRLLSKYPTRGKFRTLSEKKLDFTKSLPILADEFVGDGYLLYCGTQEEYYVVKVGKDYPVYFRESVKLVPVETTENPTAEESSGTAG